ncbi:MAG: cation transporter [Burkholderiales bacterium]|nr:cation transporter [Burkholderiales bacterium]
MSSHCCHTPEPQAHVPAAYRRVLWIALIVNALMFAVEVGAGIASGSVALLADAIDFFADAANYGVSIAVLAFGLVWRSRVAMLKATTMLAFAVFVIGRAAWSAVAGGVPEPATMGAVGALALAANLSVAAMLYAWRNGDADMRSVWLCTRNDAIGNVAVMVAALGVFGSGTAWPDLAVAAIMAGLSASAGWSVLRQARREISAAASPG